MGQSRYLGGRPPYGYRLADADPHPNKAHAAWDRRAHRLEPDPDTAPVVRWMVAQRLAGHSARITRALNDAGIPCPSAADPKRNPHRSGTAWTLRTVAAILANPRYGLGDDRVDGRQLLIDYPLCLRGEVDEDLAPVGGVGRRSTRPRRTGTRRGTRALGSSSSRFWSCAGSSMVPDWLNSPATTEYCVEFTIRFQ
jgi:hypothetical protein